MATEVQSDVIAALKASTAPRFGYPTRLNVHTTAGILVLEENEVIRSRSLEMPVHIAERKRKNGFERSPRPMELKLEPHRRPIAGFGRAVREGKDAVVTGEDAHETRYFVLAAYTSAREGRGISLEGG